MDSIELNEAQLTCLASPVRGEVYETIRSYGAASVGDIGRSMNRSPESLYYHVKVLMDCALIREHSRRATQRKPEVVYEVAAANLKLPDLAKNPQLAEITRRAVAAGLRRTERGYLKAAREAEVNPAIKGTMHIIRAKTRLSPADAQELMSLIERAVQFAKEHESDDGIRLSWSSVVYPDHATAKPAR